LTTKVDASNAQLTPELKQETFADQISANKERSSNKMVLALFAKTTLEEMV
jgi:hypothetical protein